MIDPSSIHITRIWWMLALETFNSILVRIIPSTLPKTSSFLSSFSVYTFSAYCLCVYIPRMNLYECFWVAMFYLLNPCISAIFNALMNIWMIFIGRKIRIDTLFFTTAPLLFCLFVSWFRDARELNRIYSDECCRIQTGFRKSAYGCHW